MIYSCDEEVRFRPSNSDSDSVVTFADKPPVLNFEISVFSFRFSVSSVPQQPLTTPSHRAISDNYISFGFVVKFSTFHVKRRNLICGFKNFPFHLFAMLGAHCTILHPTLHCTHGPSVRECASRSRSRYTVEQLYRESGIAQANRTGRDRRAEWALIRNHPIQVYGSGNSVQFNLP